MKKSPRLGNYEVLRELETGGMGKVLLARKRGAGGFEKLFAIKIMRSELRDQDAVRDMFLDEARLLARIEHPAVAQVYDFGDDDGALYLVMEYVSGLDFRQVIALEPPPGVAARLIAAACRGLHAAHELTDLSGKPLGVVHRDVSPENLMLTFDGHVKVLDFGIALMRDRRAPVTEFGTIKGKPPYLSPEQVKNEAIDRRTDIFAACIVLHEMLTGEPVFTGGSVYAVARAIEHEPIPPPSDTCGLLPLGLDEAVLRGVQRDPADRFATALELAEQLERIADNEQAETLDVFVRRELGEQRARHRKELRAMLDGTASEFSRARPTGVMTALADTDPGPEVAAAGKALGLRIGGDSASDSTVGAGKPSSDPDDPDERDDGDTAGAGVDPGFRVTQLSERVPVVDETARGGDGGSPDEREGESPSRVSRTLVRVAALAALFGLFGAGVAWFSRTSSGENNAEAVGLAVERAPGERDHVPVAVDDPVRPDDGAATQDPAQSAVIPGSGDESGARSGGAGEPAGSATADRRGTDPPSRVTDDRDRQNGKKPRRTRRDRNRTGDGQGSGQGDAEKPEETPKKSDDPAPAVATGTGKVTITAEGAYALVRIDGKGMGTTPIFGLELPAGKHTIILARPDSGEVRLERVVDVEAGDHHRIKAE